MTGYVAIHRGLLKHPVFADEPFTEREAWMWLISEAAWQPKRVRSGRMPVDLKRGQLCHSRSYMAKAWKWHPSRVYRFINKIASDGMLEIEQLPNHESNRITICNYDKYQPSRTASEQPTEQRPNSDRTQEEELKELKKDHVVGEPLLTPNAMELAGEVAAIAGLPDPMNWPPGWCGAPMRVAQWISQGWRRDIILAAARGAMMRKRDGPPWSIQFFERAIAKAHAQQSAPLPQVEIIQGETVRVVQDRGNVIAAADRLLERVRSFDQPAPSAICDGTGSPDVRVLPKG